MLGQLALIAPDKELPLRKRVELQIVSLADVRYMLEKFHYLNRVRTGRQINYAVLIDGVVDGVVTYAYPMISVPIEGIPSDEILEFARLFLYSNIPHTATCAIGKSLRRVKDDWVNRFLDSKEPRLVISWSDKTYHKGTIYKAANFKWHHLTLGGGGGRNTTGKRPMHEDLNHEKDCWIYQL